MPISIYDMIVLSLLVVAFCWGFWKGLAWQAASLAGIFLSWFVAYAFADPLSTAINTEAPWNKFLAMLILFLGTSLVIWVAYIFVSSYIEKMKLDNFDRQIGGVLGLVKGVVLAAILTLFCVALLPAEKKQVVLQSHSGYWIAVVLNRVRYIVPAETQEVVGPYIDDLETQLDESERIVVP